MTSPTPRRALISGASIAGPALGYWLTRHGWHVTLVERAAHVRGGGYPIDLRGTAVEVAKRMGLYDDIRGKQVGRRATQVLNQRGRRIATLDFSTLTNDDASGDVELPRGELTKILYDATKDDIEYVFSESIAALTPHDDRVDVTFASGRTDSFDIVVGADGIHSGTRRLVFGPEEDYIRHLGPIVAIWDEPDSDRKPSTGTMYNLPGRVAMHMRENTGPARGFIAFVVGDPGAVDLGDPALAARLARTAFEGHLIPLMTEMIADLERADDLFFDTVSQIHMDAWSKGRVVLVGDSAFAPSFLSGQGTSIALIGAYVLATELVADPDPERAFAAYEARIRAFVERNQAIAVRRNTNALPRDAEMLRKRNLKLWALPWLQRTGLLRLLDRGYRATPTSFSIDGYGLTD